jgi:AcrR family transcriptional regulator
MARARGLGYRPDSHEGMQVTRGTGPKARQPRRPVKSRQDELLDEAARHLNARGVLMTSLTDIADGLQVSRAALYYYVDDREDLVFKVYRRSMEILARRLGEAARSGRRALEVVDAFVSTTLDPKEPEIAALSEVGLLRGPERETVLGLYEGVVARLASVLETGARAGEVRVCDFDVAARCIISMIHWTPLAPRWNVTDVFDRAGVVAFMGEVIRAGVATHRAELADPPLIDVSPLLAPAISTLDQGALRDAKREAILLAASRLFNEKGVDTTSLDEIAAALGTNKRALYRYVGDKQAIVTACYERAFRIAFFVADRIDSLNLSPADQLDAQQRANALVQQNRDICPLRRDSGLDTLSAEGRAAVTSLARRFSDWARQRFEAAREAGDVRPLDVDDFLLVAASPSAWVAKPFVQAPPSRQVEIANAIADFVRLGLAPLGPQTA